jgi:hypothetical protein
MHYNCATLEQDLPSVILCKAAEHPNLDVRVVMRLIQMLIIRYLEWLNDSLMPTHPLDSLAR